MHCKGKQGVGGEFMRVFGFMLNSLTFYFIPPNMRIDYFVLNPQTGSHDVDAVVDAADAARYRY